MCRLKQNKNFRTWYSPFKLTGKEKPISPPPEKHDYSSLYKVNSLSFCCLHWLPGFPGIYFSHHTKQTNRSPSQTHFYRTLSQTHFYRTLSQTHFYRTPSQTHFYRTLSFTNRLLQNSFTNTLLQNTFTNTLFQNLFIH